MNQEEIKKEEALDQPTMSFFSRITGALFSPSKTFSYLNKRSDVLGAMIIIIIFALSMSVIYLQKTDLEKVIELRLEQSGRLEELTEEQRVRAIEIGAKFGKISMYAAPIIVTPIIYLIIAGVMHLIFSLFHGDTTFKKVFSVVTYSFLPAVFYYCIGIMLLLTKKVNEMPFENLVKSNFSVLLVQEETSKFLWNLASSIDLFNIWSVVLLSIGMAAISKIKLRTSFIVVGILWVGMILILALLRGLGG